jgi:hypothetical protein
VVGLGVLLLAGCRSVVETDIQSDGSGVLTTAIVYSAEELANFSRAPGNAGKSICDRNRQDLPPGAAFSEEEREGETFCTISRGFADLNELEDLYRGIGGVAVDELGFQLGVLAFDVRVDLSGVEAGEGGGSEWRVSLPGSVRRHNADRVEARTLIWHIGPGEARALQAESDAGLRWETLGPMGVLILLLLVSIAAGTAVLAVRVRR